MRLINKFTKKEYKVKILLSLKWIEVYFDNDFH